MTYKKFSVDNTACSRRFHLSTDDAADPAPRVEVKCQYCDMTIFKAENHPPVHLARVENLVKTTQLSDLLVSECHQEDVLTRRTRPEGGAKAPAAGKPHA